MFKNIQLNSYIPYQLGILLCMLIALSGCVNKNYLQRLPVIAQAAYCQTEGAITLRVHELNARESKSYFGVNLPDKGYIPLQISIINQGPDTFVLRPSYLDLYPAPASEIAEYLHYDTSRFLYLVGAPALLFWWPGAIWAAQGGYGMYSANKRIDGLVDRLALEWQTSEIIIQPYDTFERFIFVSAQEYRPNFGLRLYNQDAKKLLTFIVDVRMKSY